jgi:hypothetical protein
MSDRCGCCEPPVGLVPLSLENRPGLPALAYRIGTYSSFRETLLHRLSGPAGLPALTTRADDDFAITVVDLWATVADVLTFYQERYANEAFLRTARERTSVARLARLTGYALRPGAAATTQLVFAVDRAAGSLTIPARLRVKSVPAQGETAQTYETLAQLTADARLNALRVLPPPEPANPLAPGATEALLAPGPTARRAAGALAPSDRLLVFDSHTAPEELVVAEVRSEDERTTLRWTAPVRGAGWSTSSHVVKAGRSFTLFGRSAPATYMTPTPSGATVSWTLSVRADADWKIAASGSTLQLEGTVDLKVGDRLLLTGAGSPMVLTVAGTSAVRGEFAPLAGPATEVIVAELLPVLDRRTVVLHELLGEPVRFWGYAYPPTLSPATVYVAGHRIDSTTFELSGGAGRLDLRELELGRAMMLSDERQTGIPATLVSASLTAPEPMIAAIASQDATRLAGFGLGPGQAVAALVSAPLASGAGTAAELEVTIGKVGPRTIVLDGGTPVADELERRLNAADTAAEFRRARVVALASRLVVVPGAAAARVGFAGTKADPAAAVRFGLDEEHARPALLAERSLTPLGGVFPGVQALLGAGTPKPLGGVPPPPGGSSPAGTLQALIRALPGRAFQDALVVARGWRLLLLSGLTQAESQDYLRLGLVVPAGTVLDADSAVLAGNVVGSSHGETVRDETVGSGDASVPFQRLALKKKPLTYLPGAAGAGSSLQLLVNGVRWNEVATLFTAGPTERVFAADEGDEGEAVLRFGDGQTGARLPSGMGNVHATYRVGSGLSGRVRAATLMALLDRPRGLASVSNPLAADGGADPEPADAARANAPQTVRTFGRAVSLRDFEDLARSTGEVAKAQAIWAWDGFARAVHLTVAQVGGGTFSREGLGRIAGELDVARDPNHPLHVVNAGAVSVVVSARIGVAADRPQANVAAAARAALASALGFEAVRLGEPVFLSDVFRVLQDVEGVEWVDVDELGFKQPADRTASDWDAELTRRGVERTAAGAVARVQSRLRIFPARPDPDRRGRVLPAELAQVEAPSRDLSLTAEGGLAA